MGDIGYFLFDNGSLRPAAVLNLRRLADRLQARWAVNVMPVSLLHSNRIDPELLENKPTILLETALRNFAGKGGTRAVLLPLFFGPSGALTEYIPERLAGLKLEFPYFEAELAGCLVAKGDDSSELVAQAIAKRVEQSMETAQIKTPWVIVTDHGSPLPEVTDVRNRVGEAVQTLLKGRAAKVAVASMERRPGDAYAFNEPLLTTALADAIKAGARDIIVALQFLQAGRHAGEDGDITRICDAASVGVKCVRIVQTDLLANSLEVSYLLERRLHAALKVRSWTQ